MRLRRVSTGVMCLLIAVAAAACTGGSTRSVDRKPIAHVLIDPNGSIAGIAPGEPRAKVEAQLGEGTTVSHRMRSSSGRAFLQERIRYPRSGLTVLYVRPQGKPEAVFAVFTASPRYHTRDGLHIGSSLADAQHADEIRCSPQLGTRFACQGGLGFEKPVSGFDVRDGHVVRFALVAVAD